MLFESYLVQSRLGDSLKTSGRDYNLLETNINNDVTIDVRVNVSEYRVFVDMRPSKSQLTAMNK